MNTHDIYEAFSKAFDIVKIIKTDDYLCEAQKMGKKVPHETYQTMVVVGLAYPMRVIKHTKTHLVPSFYTFGQDYHHVLKQRIINSMKDMPYAYKMGVDNHQHDERLAAVVSGLGYFAKNQLIITKSFGSYVFLGVVFIDAAFLEATTLDVLDDCGDCRICINACPTNALSDEGFNVDLCMSHYNQAKTVLTELQMSSNYSLFGCDICQMVCPKNVKKGTIVHPEFALSGKEMVSIVDIFASSEKTFMETYKNMAYLWKGKTMLMRNACMLLYRHQNKTYIPLIKQTLSKPYPSWYLETAKKVIKDLESI